MINWRRSSRFTTHLILWHARAYTRIPPWPKILSKSKDHLRMKASSIDFRERVSWKPLSISWFPSLSSSSSSLSFQVSSATLPRLNNLESRSHSKTTLTSNWLRRQRRRRRSWRKRSIMLRKMVSNLSPSWSQRLRSRLKASRGRKEKRQPMGLIQARSRLLSVVRTRWSNLKPQVTRTGWRMVWVMKILDSTIQVEEMETTKINYLHQLRKNRTNSVARQPRWIWMS